MSGEAMVCMESTMTMPGETELVASRMVSRSVSQRMRRLSESRPMRSARSLSCCALSSPDTYRMVRERMARMFWRMSVDLPMPGSPPMRVREPGTSPPPRTRLSSEEGMVMRGSSRVCISDIFCGADLV